MASKKIIIIGSGLGGLACGLILSRKGYDVTILEKHFTPGGCTQNFRRKGVNFDTGMHYVGSLDEGQTLNTLLKYFGIMPELSLERLNADGFDRVMIRNNEFKYPMGYENFKNALLAYFPQEKTAINLFVEKLKDIVINTPLYNLNTVTSTENLFQKNFIHESASSFINSLTQNQLLRDLLTGLNPLFAGNANKTFLQSYALIMNHYIESAYRFIGGSKQIVDAFIKKISEHGGRVITKAEVVEFKLKENKISQVITANNEVYEADFFISAIHPEIMLSMVPENGIRKSFRKRIQRLSNTISYFGVYLSFLPDRLPYMNYNTYFYENEKDIWVNRDAKLNQSLDKYALFPAAEKTGQKHMRSATVISLMEYNIFKKWENTKTGKRGAEYEGFKQSIAEQLINRIDRQLPGFSANIEDAYTSSPLSLRDYTHSKEGSIYGIERDYNDPLSSYLFPKTSIPNLFFTGQNLKMHGFLGVCMGALLTCGEFINLSDLLKEIRTSR